MGGRAILRPPVVVVAVASAALDPHDLGASHGDDPVQQVHAAFRAPRVDFRAWLERFGAGPATVAYDELVETTLDKLAKHLATFIDLDRLLKIAR